MPDTNLFQNYKYILKADEYTGLYLWNPSDFYCTNRNYFDNATLWTPTASATITVKNTGKPLLTTSSTTYTPNGNRPLVGQNRGYIDVTTSSTAQTVTFAGPSLSRVNDNFFRIVIRNSTASKAMTVQYIDGSNTETFNITTPSTANTWAGYTFKKGTGTLVGTMNYANAILIKVGDTSTGANYSIAAEYSAVMEMHFAGVPVVAGINCLDSFKAPYTKELGQWKCGNSPSGSFATSKAMPIELETSTVNTLLKSIFLGLLPRTETVNYDRKLGDFGISSISGAGIATITLPAGLNIVAVSVDGLPYQPTDLSVANIDEGNYVYATTTLTIGPGLGTAVGKNVSVWVNEPIQTNVTADYGDVAPPLIGYIQKNIQLQNSQIKVLICEKVTLDSVEETSSLTEQSKFTLKLTAMTTARGNFFKEFIA
jgi:hypothetical protein